VAILPPVEWRPGSYVIGGGVGQQFLMEVGCERRMSAMGQKLTLSSCITVLRH